MVTGPDIEIFDLQRFLLSDLLNANNLADIFGIDPKIGRKIMKIVVT